MPRPTVIAHRGASGYEYENSLAAFRRAVVLDADGVELDVHATQDGAIVVHHDPELPGLGPIAHADARTVREVRLHNGERVPLLSEVLELMGNRDVWVEVKALEPAWDARLLAVLDAGPAPGRYAVHSFEQALVARLGRVRPELRRGVLLSSREPDVVGTMAAVGAVTLWQEWRLVDDALVCAVHAAGCAIIAWTVNELGDLRRLARLGVDGLCGNYPDRIRVAIGLESEVPSVGF
ncbi:MAG TPA: glycerophosphodiester phosphodiesterase [Gemmatimonadales bacterium]|nr:glycerophosphodiester phosphodiesterase [Gemmatimonadales bacterium]